MSVLEVLIEVVGRNGAIAALCATTDPLWKGRKARDFLDWAAKKWPEYKSGFRPKPTAHLYMSRVEAIQLAVSETIRWTRFEVGRKRAKA